MVAKRIEEREGVMKGGDGGKSKMMKEKKGG